MARKKADKKEAEIMEERPEAKEKLTLRERVWLDAFFETLNASEAARRAYNCRSLESSWSTGGRLFKKLRGVIDAWLDEQHLSDAALKFKLVELMNATEKKLFLHQGNIVESGELPAWAPRAKGLEMAMKAKGMLKDKIELSGKVEVEQFSEEELKAAKRAARLIATEERSNGSSKRKKKEK